MKRCGGLVCVVLAMAGCTGAAEGPRVDPARRTSAEDTGEPVRPHGGKPQVRQADLATKPVDPTPPPALTVSSAKARKAPVPAGRIEDLADSTVGLAQRLLVQELAGIPANPRDQHDGLEVDGNWRALAWGNRAAARSVELPGGGGVLRLKYAGGNKDKVAVSHLEIVALAKEGNVSLDLYSRPKLPVNVAVAVFVGETRVYYESKQRQVEPRKWTRVSFDLGASDWKCQSSKWEHKASIWNRHDVREVVLLIYNGKLDGTLYVDAFQIDRAPRSDPVEQAAAEAAADGPPSPAVAGDKAPADQPAPPAGDKAPTDQPAPPAGDKVPADQSAPPAAAEDATPHAVTQGSPTEGSRTEGSRTQDGDVTE